MLLKEGKIVNRPLIGQFTTQKAFLIFYRRSHGRFYEAEIRSAGHEFKDYVRLVFVTFQRRLLAFRSTLLTVLGPEVSPETFGPKISGLSFPLERRLA